MDTNTTATPLLDSEQANERARDAALAERGLPEVAYIDNRSGLCGPSPVIGVRRGHEGYYPIWTHCTADELNEANGVTPAQREAMKNGSMFGWHTPASFPDNEINRSAR